MTLSDATTEALIGALSTFQITFLRSKPSYNNYLKTLQYIPDAIIMELPKPFHDQLHFVQMVKQNNLAWSIPIICFGEKLDEQTEAGIKKIGIDDYMSRPFPMSKLAKLVIGWIQKNKAIAKKGTGDRDADKKADVANILSPQVSPANKIDLMVKHISDIMAFPFTVSMALQILNNPNSSAAELAQIIETDPAISARFLKKANSAHYAGSSKRIISLKDAVVRIGFTESRRMITGMAVMQLFDVNNYSPGFNRIQFWMHCLATAKIAELLAVMTRAVNPDEAFLAGILHDFGIILLDEFYPQLFARILQISTNYGMRFYDAEIEMLSVSHNDIVRRLFHSWNLPQQINDAVVNHYTVIHSSMESVAPEDALTIIVSLSNNLAKAFMLGSSCDQFVVPIGNRFLSAVKLMLGLPDDFYQDVVRRLVEYGDLLKIEGDHIQSHTSKVAKSSKLTIGVMKCSGSLLYPIENYLMLRGHDIVPIAMEESAEEYAEKLDVLCVFSDASTSRDVIIPFMNIRKKEQQVSSMEENVTDGKIPVLVFVNKLSPCTTIVTLKGVSLLPEAIDLRVLDVHMTEVAAGNRVKILPWESVMKPGYTQQGDSGETVKKVQVLYGKVRQLKEQCDKTNIDSDEYNEAVRYVELARKHTSDARAAYTVISCAIEYFKKAILLNELRIIEEEIVRKKRLVEELK